MSAVVRGGFGGVAAAVGEGPAGDAWLGLLDVPAGGLLGAMVASAFRAEVALVGRAVGPGCGVVEVAVDGLGAAAGGVAGDRAGADEVFEFAARGVAALGLSVVAGAMGDGVEDDAEGLDQVAEPGCLVGVRRRPVLGVRRWRGLRSRW
jgi:hypothetical protein